MMPTLAIMATAVASAATTTDVRESEAARLRTPNMPAGPKNLRDQPFVAAVTPSTSAGTASAMDAMASKVAAYPARGLPSMGPDREMEAATTDSTAAQIRIVRHLTLARCSRN